MVIILIMGNEWPEVSLGGKECKMNLKYISPYVHYILRSAKH